MQQALADVAADTAVDEVALGIPNFELATEADMHQQFGCRTVHQIPGIGENTLRRAVDEDRFRALTLARIGKAAAG